MTARSPLLRAAGLLLTLLAITPVARPVPAATADTPATTTPGPLEAADLNWHTDYYTAYREAAREGRMLLVYFMPSENSADYVERALANRPDIRSKLQRLTLCRLPIDAEIVVDEQPHRLLASGAFRELRGKAGVVLIDLVHRGARYYGYPVTVLPLASGKYYRWSDEGLATALDLPSGSLSQRTMIWAVRMHPEDPHSADGRFHPQLAAGATQHSAYQARVQVQGHQNFESRFHQLSSAAGGSVTEVVAESWPNQDLIDSCIDCVASWRHSSGHWSAVRRPNRAFGYDIRRGANGIWYGTGLFAQ